MSNEMAELTGKADLHIHTQEGDGLDSVDAILDHVERSAVADVIAITEHDDPFVGLRARDLAARRRLSFDVVPGVEVTTLQGHLVALFLEEPVASFKRIEETIAAIHRKGGLCFVPHPMNWLTRSVSASTLERLVAGTGDGLAPDGLELANPSPTARRFAGRARHLNETRYRLAEIGSSDAHFKEAIGSGITLFSGRTASDLKTALANGDVAAEESSFPSLRKAGLLRILTLPITGLRATPKKLGWRRTAWSFVSRYTT